MGARQCRIRRSLAGATVAGAVATAAGPPRRASAIAAGHRQPAGLTVTTAATPAPSRKLTRLTKLATLNALAFRMSPPQFSATRMPTARSRSLSAISESET